MKPLFTVFLFFVVLASKSQNVNIPDSVLKRIIVVNYDTNNDGEIQQSEALAVTRINITCQFYHDGGQGSGYYLTVADLTGIQSFTNLQTLIIDDLCSWGPSRSEQLRQIDFNGMANLDTLYFTSAEYLTNINLNGCTGLKYLDIETYTQGFPIIINTSLGSLDLRSCINLERLSLVGMSKPMEVALDNCQRLKSVYTMYGGDKKFTGINKLTALETFVGEDMIKFTDLNFENLRHLTTINIAGDSLVSLRTKGCPSLTEFNFDGRMPEGSFLDFGASPLLQSVGFTVSNGLPSSSPSVGINVKNGAVTQVLSNSTQLKSICADDFEVVPILNTLVNEGLQNIKVASYCTFRPGGRYNTITGNITLDQNNNGCDASDRGLQNVFVKMNTNSGQTLFASSNEQFKYSLFTYTGSFALYPYFPYPYFVLSPNQASVTFDSANSSIATRDFCIQPVGTHNDLEITFLPTFPQARPGFNAGYIATYKNRGTTTLSGNVQLNFDNNKMNFVSASETTVQSTGQLTWNYNNLQPFESKSIYITFNLLPPPVNNIDDTLVYLAAITPSANDETQFDNSFILPQRVTGSFDPNDKQCLEGSKLDISKIGDYLHYQIRFQNEGTDTAFNVVVVDTLSDNLDWNSFEFIKASHPVDVRLTNNKAEFIFENIHLPYKAINEPASNGWVAFKIKPKSSVVIGDSLNNSAAIYFDFNLPVITNTATTVVSLSSTTLPVKLEYFSISKKESSNQLNWKASCTSTSATFVIEKSDDGIHFKSIGNINATSLRCQLPFNFIDNNLINGKNYYRIKITDADGKAFYSKVLVVGNNRAGIEITAVANNTLYFNSNKQQTITMKVIAADGKEIWNERKVMLAGDNNISLQMKNAAKGVYSLIVYTNEGETILRKFIQ